VNRRYQDNIHLLRSVRRPMEARFFARKASVEAKAIALHKHSPARAAKFLTEYSNTSMLQAETAYWDLIDKLTAKYDDK